MTRSLPVSVVVPACIAFQLAARPSPVVAAPVSAVAAEDSAASAEPPDPGYGSLQGVTLMTSGAPLDRYDHAYNALAYDSGLKKSQLMLAADVIVFF
jgi:hypothetical protein